MTREEAIKIIDCYDIGFYDLSGEKIPADKLADAFDMAIEALQADAAQKLRDMPRYLNGIKVNQIKKIPSEAEQVTGKLNNPDDSLLTDDSKACKEQKSKLDLIRRQDAIAEFLDGRDVYDIMESIEELPSAETPTVLEKHQLSEETPTNTSTDLISRQAAIDEIKSLYEWHDTVTEDRAVDHLKRLPTIEQDGDLISRQDAVNEIHKYFVAEIDKTPTEIDEDGNEFYADMPTVNSLLACNKELSKRIKSLPSAPDSRQRGEWVTTAADSHVFTDKFQENIRENIFGGADMRGGEDE